MRLPRDLAGAWGRRRNHRPLVKASSSRVLAAAALLISLALVAALPSAATAATDSPANVTAASLTAEQMSATKGLATCVQARQRLDVVLMLDESGSLLGTPRQPGTDPDAQRVAGAKAAIDGLVQLSQGSNGKSRVAVSLLLAGFSGSIESAPAFHDKKDNFQRVNPATRQGLFEQADQFRNRNTGDFTDYRQAFDWSQQALADKAAAETRTADQPACQVVVFFTDGKFDPPGNFQQARAALCAPGGIMDGLRRDGVFTFAVGLSSQLAAGDADFLHALTDGNSPGSRCGTGASPSTGLFLSVADRDRLIFLFGNLFTDPPTTPLSCRLVNGVCRVTLTVPAVVDRFSLLATTGGDGGYLQVTSPDRVRTTVRPDTPGTWQVGQGTLSSIWLSSHSVKVEQTFSAQPRTTGTWTIEIHSPGQTLPVYTVQYFSNASVALDSPRNLVAGQSAHLQFHLVDTQGQPLASASVPQGTTLSAGIGAAGASTQAPLDIAGAAGTFSAEYAVPDNSQAASYQITARAVFPSVNGVAIATPIRSFSLARELPSYYPHVSPTTLHFPAIDKTKSVSTSITVTADPKAGGCAWISSLTLSGPKQAKGLDVSVQPRANSANFCLHVAAGQSAQLTLRVHPEHWARGAATGHVVVGVTSSRDSRPQYLDIPADVRLTKKHGAGPLALRMILFLFGAVAIPVLLLHLLNWFGAKIGPPQLLRVARIPVLAGADGQVLRQDTRQPLTAEQGAYQAMSTVGRPRRKRRLLIPETTLTITAIASGSRRDRRLQLLRGPYARATSVRPFVAGHKSALAPALPSGAFEVPLNLVDTWFLVLEPTISSMPRQDSNEFAGAPSASETAGIRPQAGTWIGIVADGASIEAMPALCDQSMLVLQDAMRQLVAPPGQNQAAGDSPLPPAADDDQLKPSTDTPNRSSTGIEI